MATAKNVFGRAQDLPWKMFPAKLVQAAGAHVIPVYFEGQNGRLFHLASKVSLTLRLSLLIREFRRLSGSTITARIGATIPWATLAASDRKGIMARLHDAVFAMAPARRSLRKRAG